MAQSQLYPVGAAVVLLATIYIAQRIRLGPHADWVEIVRATCLPILDPVIERAVGGVGAAYEIGDEEFVGVIAETPEAVEQLFWVSDVAATWRVRTSHPRMVASNSTCSLS